MTLIRKSNDYIIEEKTSIFKFYGRVYFIDEEMNVNMQVYLLNDNYIGNCSYKYINKNNCSKVIGDCKRKYMNSLGEAIENIIDSLVEYFQLQ